MTNPARPADRQPDKGKATATYGQRDISAAAQKSKVETTRASDVPIVTSPGAAEGPPKS